MTPTPLQREVAAHMALPPDPNLWPMEIIDRLIHTLRERGSEAYQREIRTLLSPRP